ncbi:dual specificity protein phosphatase 1-like [Centruroides sculpturatus]|uniref:dual specificity protein phosphatase 1-like n=1 Tax=Centruroides sculpturatus TaxID=218467 RepID=UPI000C6EE90B|nr:dual specificity protein phosphatase 1-like [Centruroides sculpturatus]
MPTFDQYSEPRRSRFRRGMANTTMCLSADILRKYLEEDNSSDSLKVLILDCRSFLAYNDGHIIDSLNIHCPSILRRRSGGTLPLSTLISDARVRDLILTNVHRTIILYEEHSRPIHDDTMTSFVAKCLKNEIGRTVLVLEGGYQQFSQSYPHLCTKPLTPIPSNGMISPSMLTNALNGRLSAPCPNQDQEEPVEILPYLYLGSEYHASCKETLQRLGITSLLNVSQNCPNRFEDSFIYKSIPVEDSGNEDIAIWFNEAIDFIERIKSENGKILVHCHAGISRSATICMAYIMATKRIRMDEAYEYVKSKRRIVSPNFNFMGQLLSFESQVFAPSSRCKPTPSPRSPLVAIVATTPDADSLTPSLGAQQNVFDFTMTSTPSHICI